MFTYEFRTEQGAVGYSVVWKDGLGWDGVKSHMGYNQEAFHAGCAAPSPVHWSWRRRDRGHQEGSPSFRMRKRPSGGWRRRNRAPEKPGPGQVHAIEVRRWIAAIWRANPAVAIEIR